VLNGFDAADTDDGARQFHQLLSGRDATPVTLNLLAVLQLPGALAHVNADP
jgi:hypothetical protein